MKVYEHTRLEVYDDSGVYLGEVWGCYDQTGTRWNKSSDQWRWYGRRCRWDGTERSGSREFRSREEAIKHVTEES